MKKFEHRVDSGRLMATQSKRHEKSPDYYGDIAINVKDLTKVEKQGDLLIFRINGWKRQSPAGATYLSLSVDRWVVDQVKKPVPKGEIADDIPW